MENRYIMTAFGRDRPGIVAEVTRLLFENGCNLQDTTMTMLADEFTLNLLFTCRDPGIESDLERACRRLERERGVSAFVRRLESRRESRPGTPPPCVLHVQGEDQAGIVYRVSQFLAARGVNIVDLKSTVRPAPGSGTPNYVMDIHIDLPPGVEPEALEEALEAVADELHVDITLICRRS